MDEGAPLDPEEARLRPTYAVVSLGRLRANLTAVRPRRPGAGDGRPQGERVRPRPRGRGALPRPAGRRLRRRPRRGGHRPSEARDQEADPGDGRHLDPADPALPRARPHHHRAVDRPPRRPRGGGGGGGARGPRPPQDRHRHGADRRPLLQRAEPPRGGRPLAPRAGGGDLLPLRERRRGGPLPRPPAARALPRGAALLRAPLAARPGAPHRELGGAPAHARVAPRHGPTGDPALRRLPLRPGHRRRRGEAGPVVAHARRVLQGRRARQPRDATARPGGATTACDW